MEHTRLDRIIASYHNADAVHRFLLRCLLSALAFPIGYAVMEHLR